jgi:hypothetical protein
MMSQPAAVTGADLAVARRYAEVYAAFDAETLRSVLHPGPRFRQINPGGYLALDSAAAYINATAGTIGC